MSHETAVAAGAAKEPTAIAERLTFAYNGAVPQMIAEFYDWKLSTSAITADQSYQDSERAKTIARSIGAREEVAYQRIPEARQRLLDLEKRRLEFQNESLTVAAYLATDPPVTASAADVGMMLVRKAGCERLMPSIERALVAARLEPEKAEREAANWKVLADLADVIAGVTTPSGILAQKLGLEGAWQICPPLIRAARERERKERQAAEIAVAPQKEAERIGMAERAEEAAEAFKARQNAIAEIDTMDFHALLGYVFGARRELLEGMGTFKVVIAAWPDRPEPNVSRGARSELGALLDETGLDQRRNRAISRLQQLIAT
jgi:hypothetical protein